MSIGTIMIVLGADAVERAKALRPNGSSLRFGQEPRTPSLTAPFTQRLSWFLEVQQGRNIVAAEPLSPLALPVAHRRMLERLALGYGARYAPNGQPGGWLTGSGLGAPEPVLGVLGGVKAPGEAPAPALDAPGAAATPLQGPAARYGALGRWPEAGAGPVVLLLGDRPGPGWQRAGRPSWPFISSLSTGCSSWLAELLEEHGIPEDALAWMNTYSVEGEPRGAEDVEAAPFRKVIALGRNAATWCSVNGVKHEEVHHPQYWKRYQHHNPYILPRLIKKELNHEAQ